MLRDPLLSRKCFGSVAVLALVAACLCWVRPAHAEPQAFHLLEINKVMVGYNSNMAIQAVELKMITAGENFVQGLSIAVYDSTDGGLGTILGTFAGNVPNAAAGERILCATAGFASAFSITPDLVITPGLRMFTGQVAFEGVGCRVNSVAYGNVPLPLTGLTSAPPLLPHGATALVRITDNPTVPSCPQAENSAARFQLRGAGAANPFVFQNNARDTAQVWTSITSVEGDPVPDVGTPLRASPNPFTRSTEIALPSGAAGPVTVFDISGRVVREWNALPSSSAIVWDGRDRSGRTLPAGLYFVEARTVQGSIRGRVLLLR
jgi:FlgD Ig-like domain